jgi:hypothetical protein
MAVLGDPWHGDQTRENLVAGASSMIESLMLCGIGVLAGCLLTLVSVPLVHQRAVRLTTRNIVEAMPLAANEIQADKDQLRAQFAVAMRQLEVSIDDLRTKSANQLGQIGRSAAEINHLRVELDKRAAYIFALQAREHVRGSIVRRVVKIVLYLFVRSTREERIRLGAMRRAEMNLARAA